MTPAAIAVAALVAFVGLWLVFKVVKLVVKLILLAVVIGALAIGYGVATGRIALPS